MIYYRVDEDWITQLEGPLRAEVVTILRGLKLERLQKYPPPKLGGLPLGNETRVLKKFVRGASSQLDASALHKFYLSFASKDEKLLYRAFRQHAALKREDWADVIGAENIDKWVENKLLHMNENGFVHACFSIASLDGLVFLVDPMNDHGGPHLTAAMPAGYNPDTDDPNIRPYNHTYMGLDSQRQIDVMEQGHVGTGGRYLDCGPGAGALLLYFSRRYSEAVGIDINPRAVILSHFNAELNSLDNVRTCEDDALKLGDKYGKFDLLTWNLPFIFIPEEAGEEAVDGFGGELGIGLCLAFIDKLPGLLTENGLAVIAAMAPIMNTGENVLEERLKGKLVSLELDCTLQVAQISLAHTRELWQFHQSHGIRKFESVYLYLKPGKGNFERFEAPAGRKVLDVVREKMYQRKFG